MYDGIPYGRYLDTSSCRVSVDSIRLKFTYKYQNYSYEKNVLSPPLTNFPAILTICFLMAVIQNGHTRTFFKLALTVGLVPSPVLTGPALCYLAAIATIVLVSKSHRKLSSISTLIRFL